jgi:hypothetical protein
MEKKNLSDPVINSELIYSNLYQLPSWVRVLPDKFDQSRIYVCNLLNSSSFTAFEAMIENNDALKKAIFCQCKAISEG